jgi:cold shock CspA family protein
MRSKGKITSWKSDKGYGFITPSEGAKQVFVHISSFRSRSPRPEVNQLVTFTLSADQQGRTCAVDVARENEQVRLKKSPKNRPSRAKSAIVLLIVFVMATAFVYSKYKKSQVGTYVPPRTAQPSSVISSPEVSSRFSCDGRTHCSDMTSCAEAKFFIQNCPNTKMDGDGDGVPCESQWCGN